jgi:hypothetical protein
VKQNVKFSYGKGEAGVWDLIYTNIIHKDRRLSFFAVIGFQTFTGLSGQTFNDTYSKNVFDILADSESYGYKVTFYSGFTCFAGSILGGFVIKSMSRKDFILGAYMAQVICM